ncbi:MAG TPA: acyl-CoA synthetase [Terriglobia bacterium]|nr:acyl-CoA synthetase [Terriglobia bacterium]
MTTSRTAIIDPSGVYSYDQLDSASTCVAGSLLDGASGDLEEARVAFMVAPGFRYAAIQRGVWRAGGVAAPLALSHPPAELEYVVRDTGAAMVVGDASCVGILQPIARAAGARFIETGDALGASAAGSILPVDPGRRAMIIYTSGSTGRPKGVVSSHANIAAQVASLVEAWQWSPSDRLLLTLPMHHVHGVINGLGSALTSGAICEFLPSFDPEAVWARLASGEITVFTAVPTIYHRLIATWEAAPAATQQAWSQGAARLRLMMSGSAALPVRTLERWRELTGHTLLERYGMTEIGMALSNPLHGERRAGSVGQPLPNVEVRLVDESGAATPEGAPGELEVRGPSVFVEYWRRSDETQGSFRDGWFRTGDVAVFERGAYRLLGRTSVDIIKTGGFKVSALEIEETLRLHPAIVECAVVGLNDEEWGERVAAAIEARPGADLSLDGLQQWARSRLAPYKVPRALRIVPALPRNAMGKVVKPQVSSLFK